MVGGIFKKRAIGLDIADRSVEVVEIEKSGTFVKIIKKNRVVLQKGIIERGRVKDKKIFIKILDKLFREAKPEPIDKEEVVFGLPEAQTYPLIFKIDLKKRGIKKLSENERENIIFDRVKKNIPIPNDEVVYDFRIIEQTKDFEEILAIATNKKTVSSWQKLFKEAKINVKIFDFESLATYRGLEKEKNKEVLCIADIGAVTTNYSIYSRGQLKYEYSYPKAGNHITRVLAKELKVQREMAESEKFNIDILKGDKLANMSIKAIQPIMDELRSSLDYFEKKYNEKVNKIILVGGSSKIKGLSDYLSTNLERDVSVGKTALKEKGPNQLYVEAVGLAMKTLSDKDKEPYISSEKIDHTQEVKEDYEEFTQEKKENVSKKKLIIFLIIILVGALAIAASFWYREKSREKRSNLQMNMIEELDNSPQINEISEEEEQLISTTSEIIASSTDMELNDNQQDLATTTGEDIRTENIQEEIINYLDIKDTPTGWLNVRNGPSTDSQIIDKVYTGETYEYLSSSGEWYLIKLSSGRQGWIHGFYVQLK